MSLSEFFNSDDGLTSSGVVSSTSALIVGYFDIVNSDVFLDDSPAGTRGEFVCRASDVAKTIVGDSITIDSVIYRINGYLPDGSGLVTLTLYNEE